MKKLGETFSWQQEWIHYRVNDCVTDIVGIPSWGSIWVPQGSVKMIDAKQGKYETIFEKYWSVKERELAK